MRVTVFTGSSAGSNPSYAKAAARLGADLATAGVGVVYGGAHVGLMGVLADAALGAGGEVIGVMPRSLVDREIAHRGLTRLEVVESMHERKLRMAELGDGSLALPGGIGTLEEFFESWTWQILGLHAKPVMLFDVDGFWAPLNALVDHLVETGFLGAAYRRSLATVTYAGAVVERIGSWESTAPKWGR